MNPFKTLWRRLFPPPHIPQADEYYRSQMFPNLTCRVQHVSDGLVVFELLRCGKEPFELLKPPIKVDDIGAFNEIWESYDE